MTAGLEGGEWSAARPGRTLPRERTGAHFTGGYVVHVKYPLLLSDFSETQICSPDFRKTLKYKIS